MPTNRTPSDTDGIAKLSETLGSSVLNGLISTLDMHAIVAITDENGVIVYANRRFCELSKYTTAELYGKTHRIINSGYHSKEFWERMWATVSSGETWHAQVCNRAKDGSFYWLQTTVRPLVGKDGNIEAYVSIRTDITKQKETERGLQLSRERLRWAAKSAKLGSWEYDLQTDLLNWSWMTKIIHEVEENYEPNFDEAIAFCDGEEHRQRLEIAFKNAIEKGSAWNEELVIVTGNGVRKWVRSIGEPKIVNGQCVSLAGVYQDIDEEIARRRAAERDAAMVRSILDASTEFAIIATDDNGQISVFNTGAERTFGYSARESSGQLSLAELFTAKAIQNRSEELAEKFDIHVGGFQVFAEIAAKKGFDSRTWQGSRQDGSSFEFAAVITPIHSVSGEVGGYLCIGQDVTEINEARRAAEESERKFRGAFDASAVGMGLVALDGGWISANSAMVEILAVDLETLKSRTLESHYDPEDLVEDRDFRIEMIEGQRKMHKVRRRFLRPNGETIWVALTVSLVKRADNKPAYFLCQLENVTRSVRLEADLKKTTNRLSLAAKAGGIGIWDWDLVENKLVWDEQLYRLHGLSPETTVASLETWNQILHPDDGRRVREEMENAILDIKEFDSEYRIVTPTKSVRNIRTLALIERDENGKAIRAVGSSWDVTKTVRQREDLAKAVEEAKQASEAKSRFLANMSHELRTPLNGVMGMTTLLLGSDGLLDEQRQFVEVIRDSGESLLSVINDILDFSKIDSGKLQIEEYDFNLGNLVAEISSVISQRAKLKDLEYFQQIDPKLPLELRGDPVRLRQILINLTSNAVKFTDKGNIRLSVALKGESEEGVELVFKISDTGVGIDEELKDKLFEEFTQADNSSTREHGGTGLGLAITKRLVQLIGGKIDFVSTLGTGSVFTVSFQFKRAQGKGNYSKPLFLRDRSALLISKDPEFREELEEVLNLWSIYTGSCSTVEQAAELVQNRAAVNAPLHYIFVDGRDLTFDLENFRKCMEESSASLKTKLILIGNHKVDPRGESLIETLALPLKQSDVYDLLVSGEDASNYTDISFEDVDTSRFEGRSTRVLIAEDNFVNQMVIKGMLLKMGIEADCVSNGAEAIEAVKKTPYDLIFMDIQMPEIDGLEASRQIRGGAAGERAKSVVIVAITANARDVDRQDCADVRMDAYLLKPVEVSPLFSTLDRLLPGYRSDEENFDDSNVPPSNQDIFESEELVHAMMDDVSLAVEVINASMPDLQTRLPKFQTAFESGDERDARYQIHSLKGTAANLRCRRLKRVCKTIEDAIIEPSMKDVSILVEGLKTELEEAIRALKDFLAKQDEQ
ncbi:PAS domain S-box protein [Pelagicoccus albus]|uniref:Sensory/regulatory protein RpfC n=1 Tax=Pelagicoccus albus TaxID=415222 RepID=A0A7X1BAQ3_9BACT|nr:PAS domain S-box protein [Pelagicoccus albus]MBC2607543.1 PAS domain S-box protein [Pelagicoccus albus]